MVVSAFEYSVRRGDVRLGAFVVMPDHFHVLVGLCENITLRSWMHGRMSFIAGKTNAFLRSQGCSWQDGYYDTEVRSRKQFYYLVDYILNNPVVAGLVGSPEKWDASSAGGYDWVDLTW